MNHTEDGLSTCVAVNLLKNIEEYIYKYKICTRTKKKKLSTQIFRLRAHIR
jgi:hypothetical protein